jgi:hypothetical protein
MRKQNKTPDGYMKNASGNLVPVENVKEIDILRDELVTDLFREAIIQAAIGHKFKMKALDEIAAFVSTSALEYDKEIGGEKGNVHLTSYDGRFRVTRAMQDQLDFDERLLVAKDLISECLNDWTEGSTQELKLLVTEAFERNGAGQVSTSRILGLRKFKFTDPRWAQAMEAIADSIKVSSVKTYLRFHARDEKTGRYEHMPLDGSVDPKSLFPDSE